MKKILITMIVAFVTVSLANAQVPKPADPQTGSILLRGGIAHLGNGEVIQNSVISIVDGKIGICADATVVRIDMSQFDETIDITGKHVYPGLILPNSNLGLVEVNAVRATRDFSEVGGMNPNVRSLIAYNTDSELIPTLRYNGILLAQSVPQGGVISGSSSVMKLDGWNWEDAAYKTDDGIHLRWPAKSFGPRWWLGETARRENKNYAKTTGNIDVMFKDAKAYGELGGNTEKNLKLAALQGVLGGSQTLFIHANGRTESMEGIQWAKKMGVQKIVLVGGSDAYHMMDFLKDNQIPVLLTDIHRVPNREEEDIDLPFRLPGILQNQGILVGLTYRNLMSSRNLPFFAGTAVAYGLDKEEALKLITSNTAKILGIDDRTGTLEADKDANIIISTGDLLDMRTNNVEMAFIQGRKLNLDGKQQLLYERFKEKYSNK